MEYENNLEKLQVIKKGTNVLLEEDDVSKKIQDLLRLIREYFGADRAYIFEVHHDEGLLYNTFEVCNEHIIAQIDNLQALPLDIISYWLKEFGKSRYIYIPNVDDLDIKRSEEKEILLRQGIESLIVVPFVYGQEIEGFIGVDNPKINKNDTDFMQIMCNLIFGKTLEERFLQQANRLFKKETIILSATEGAYANLRLVEGRMELASVSDNIEKIAGYTPRELLKIYGRDIIPLIYKEDIFKLKNELEHLASGQSNVISNYRIIKKDGSLIRVKTYARVVHQKDNGSVLLNVFFTKALEDFDRQLNIIEKAPHGVYVVEEESKEVLYCNQKFLEIFDCVGKNYIGQKCYEFCGQGSWCCEDCIDENSSSNVLKRPDLGKIFRITVKDINWGGKEAKIRYLEDITEETKRTKELKLNFDTAMLSQASALVSYTIDLDENIILNKTSSLGDKKGFDKKKISIEALKRYCIKNMQEEKDKNFLKGLDKNKLENYYYRGNAEFKKVFKYSFLEKVYWLETKFKILKHPSNGHLVCVIYIDDITKSILIEKFMKNIISSEFDFAGMVDVSSGRFVFYSNDKYQKKENPQYGDDFFAFILSKFKRFLVGEKRIFVKEVLNPKWIISYLEDKEYYFKDFDIEFNGKKLRKCLKIAYVNKKSKLLSYVLTDLTEIYNREQEKNHKLEAVILEAKQANSAKTNFLARMSHDMRTPMNAIINLANFGLDESLEIESKGYFKKIKESSVYLLGLLNDVLELQSSIKENIKLNLECVNREDLRKEILTIVEQRAQDKGITLLSTRNDTDTDKYISCDRKRVQQIFINILNNAIKYTPCGGTVAFSSKKIKENDDSVVIEFIVEDNGVGISKEFQKHLFEPFSQEENVFSGVEGGNGLGLAISKSIVELMEGKICCESELGKGSKFFIELPFQKVSNEEKNLFVNKSLEKEVLDASKLKGKLVLICEDQIINAKIVQKILAKNEIYSDIAQNGSIGVIKAKKYQYDAILMDIRMPVMNGLEAAIEIRKFNKIVPIIALSANAYDIDIKKSLDVGMNAHLAKPIEPALLIKKLCELLK